MKMLSKAIAIEPPFTPSPKNRNEKHKLPPQTTPLTKDTILLQDSATWHQRYDSTSRFGHVAPKIRFTSRSGHVVTPKIRFYLKIRPRGTKDTIYFKVGPRGDTKDTIYFKIRPRGTQDSRYGHVARIFAETQ